MSRQLFPSGSDQSKPDFYWKEYEPFLATLRDKEAVILEVGVFQGASLKVLSRYLPRATVIGVDKALDPTVDLTGFRNAVYLECDQADASGLGAIADRHAPGGFDLIIDDASHVGYLSLQTFEALFPRLKAGGFYAVEDWPTGYVKEWPDGGQYQEIRSLPYRGELPRRILGHDHGMVGFIKHLVDLLGAPAVDGVPHPTPAPFEFMHLVHGLCVIQKLSEETRAWISEQQARAEAGAAGQS